MQNRTEFVGVPLGARVGQALKNNRELLRLLGTMLLSCIMGSSYIFGDVSPFGVAFVAAVSPRYTVTATLGAVLGYLISPVMATNMKYIGAVLLIGVAKWALPGSRLWRFGGAGAPIAAGGSLGLTSFAVTLATGIYLHTVALSFSETMLAAGASYFFSRSIQALELGAENADKNDLVCLLVTFAIGVTTLGRVTLLGLSVGRVLAVVVVLICASSSGEGPGAVAGIGAGTTASLMGGSYGFLMGGYSLGGLVAGICSSRGRLWTALSFVLANTAVSTMAPTQQLMTTAFYESAVAAAVFLLLPQSMAAQLRFARLRGRSGAEDELVRHLLLSRLQQMSHGLLDIGKTTRQVSEKLDTMAAADIGQVYSNLAQGVCRRCGFKARCWQMNYSQTMGALNDAMTVLKREQSITKSQLPGYFTNGCCRLDDFVLSLNREYSDYLRAMGTRRKVSQVRSVVTDQFEGVAMMMEDLSGELGRITTQDYKASAKVLEYFKNEGLEPSYACCFLEEGDRMTVEVVINPHKLPRMDGAKTALDLGDICGRALDLPTLSTLERGVVLTFPEKSTYTVEYGAAQLVEDGSKITGDAYQYFSDRRGGAVAILSDGMGSGGSAAVDSAMTSGLLGRLIQSGIGFDAALKMVNSALLVKSGEESLATVDIATVDLYSGKANFYKAGAAPTFVVRGGRVGYVESTSLPAGILRGVAFEKSSMTFREGDMILLVSDGVTATGVDWIPSQIESHRDAQPQELAEMLAKTAKDRVVPGRDDDITVVAMKLVRGN